MPPAPPTWQDATRRLKQARDVIEPLFTKGMRENLTTADQSAVLIAARSFCSVWLGPEFSGRTEPREDVTAYAMHLFGLGSGVINKGDIDAAFGEHALVMLHATRLLASMTALANNQAAKALTENDLRRCANVLCMVKEHILNAHRIRMMVMADSPLACTVEGCVDRYTNVDDNYNDMNDKQKLLMFLLRRLEHAGYKRFGEDCYHQRYTDKGHATRAWEKACTIKEFINYSCRKETNFQEWRWLTEHQGVAEYMHKRLVEGMELEFPELKVNRHLISFRNGIFHCKECIFLGYEARVRTMDQQMDDAAHQSDMAATDVLESDVAAMRFFDVDFPVELMDGRSFHDFPTPMLDSVLNYQRMPPDVQFWLWAFIGRMFFALHDMDHWQSVVFIKGIAGTGKSTLIDLLRYIFPPDYVGSLSSNIEQQFGLQNMYDKLIWVCPEVKENFQLNLSDLQSMVSGELVVVARKNLSPVTVQWSSPGFMVGNEIPPWKDVAGALMRRFVMFAFERKVETEDLNPRLQENLRAEIAYIVPKVVCAYLSACEHTRNQDLWSVLPEYFQKTRDKFLTSISPLADYLANGNEFVNAPNAYVSRDDFWSAFTNWAKTFRGVSGLKWSEDLYTTPFYKHRLTVCTSTRDDPETGLPRHGEWIVGITRKN